MLELVLYFFAGAGLGALIGVLIDAKKTTTEWKDIHISNLETTVEHLKTQLEQQDELIRALRAKDKNL